ncbi:MAG: hypothetical protein ACKV1O_25925 [Saprospiraceae bacterium]
MKMQPNKYTLLATLIYCLGWVFQPVLAQQNQKVLFPNPDGFITSGGSYVRPTNDGGYLLLGTAYYTDGFAGFELPRAIKVDAALQTEWDNTYLDPAENPNGIYASLISPPLELTDGGFAFGLFDTASGFDVLRLAANGNLLWGKDFPGWQNEVYPLTPLPNGSFLAARSHLPDQSGWKSYIFEFDANGDIAAEHQIEEVPYINSAILLTSGDALTVHRLQSNYVFTRVDAASNVIWQSAPIAGLSTIISPTPDGGFGVISQISVGNFRVVFFDAQGTQTGQTPTLLLPLIQLSSLGFYPDGTFLIGGRTSINKAFMARLQQDGSIVWAAESPDDGQDDLQYLIAHPTADGWGIGTGGTGAPNSQAGLFRVSENSGIFVNVITGKIGYDSDEDCLLAANESGIPHAQIKANNGTQNFFAFSGDDGSYLMILPAGDYTITVSLATQLAQYEVCLGANLNVSFPAGANGSATLDIPVHAGQILHQISGKLWLDQNNNCVGDNDDLALKHWAVHINDENGNTLGSTFTNQTGTYSLIVPAGTYTVTPILYNQNFSFCDPVTQPVTVGGLMPQYAVADFVARAETDCAQMRVSIQPIGVRPCIERTFYVNYRNDGAVPAENATLEVVLPQGMIYVSATPAPASVNGNTLFFELGQVLPSPGDVWTHVAIRISGDCDLEIGDELCVIANITPEELCGIAPGWNGAIMALEGECDENGNAVFTVKNIGNALNSAPRQILIIEDQIVLYQDNISLDPLTELMLPPLTPIGDTSTIIATVQQEPGFPGDDLVVFSLNNCVGSGGNPTGFGSNAGPFTATKCFLVVNAYDPNDKNANPLGFGEAHSVRPGTPLEYTIRFQNTGNDTAYLVVLRDTLSNHFNAARTEVLGASHDYEFALVGGNILHFTFNNILLPDSTTNLEASQGYILFRVYPKADLAQGTVVENNAAIYFDFNEPIITNTVLRTYEDFILVKTDDVRQSQSLNVNIYPNPFSTQTTFELPEGAPAGDYALELYDAAGRQLRSMAFDGSRCQVMRNALPAGLLFWKISREGRMVASGKMIAE